jgi:tRNA threonylcarbamoyladenosine biosynthesis protein TsaE
MEFSIESLSEKETKNIAKIFSGVLCESELILFHGELGGGKTTFITGLSEGLGVRCNVASPSFTLINTYDTDRDFKLIHCDFYRLENLEQILSTEISDHLNEDKNIILIEWSKELRENLNKSYLEIGFFYTHDNISKRILCFKSNNDYWDRKLIRFKELLKNENTWD